MKKLLLLLLCVPLIGVGQQTYVPDNIFEAYLEANNMGNGIANDNYVPTANIDTVTSLDVDNLNISDLTGIEDFSALNYLNCDSNQLTSLDVSQNTVLYSLECGGNNLIKLDLSNNPNLESLHCSENQLRCLNLRSGGNQNIWEITADDQDVLLFICVEVDDLAYSNNNWISNYDFSFDIGVSFSENCNNTCSNIPTLVLDIGHKNKTLLKITDFLGRETKGTKNEVLFYIYDDGTVEKKIIIE